LVAEHDLFCKPRCKHKSYCTPEHIRGETCWLFHNRRNSTFEDVTASSGIFDSSSNPLALPCRDTHGGFPDLLVANDTQPKQAYRTSAMELLKMPRWKLIAFSSEGKARAGHGRGPRRFETQVILALPSRTSITK